MHFFLSVKLSRENKTVFRTVTLSSEETLWSTSGLGLVGDPQLFLCDLFNADNKTLHQVKCHQSTLQHLRHEINQHAGPIEDQTKMINN